MASDLSMILIALNRSSWNALGSPAIALPTMPLSVATKSWSLDGDPWRFSMPLMAWRRSSRGMARFALPLVLPGPRSRESLPSAVLELGLRSSRGIDGPAWSPEPGLARLGYVVESMLNRMVDTSWARIFV